MFRKESLVIKIILQKLLSLDEINTVLDVGSSTYLFRTMFQPWIDENVFKPLRKAGCKIIHLDAKPGEGVDIVLDATELYKFNVQFDLVISANLLEHVSNISKTILGLKKVVKPGKYLLITIPYKYPYHPDPIDNTFRSDINVLRRAFANFRILFGRTISIDGYEGIKIRERIHSFIRTLPNKDLLRFNLSQLFGSFKVTITLFKKQRYVT